MEKKEILENIGIIEDNLECISRGSTEWEEDELLEDLDYWTGKLDEWEYNNE